MPNKPTTLREENLLAEYVGSLVTKKRLPKNREIKYVEIVIEMMKDLDKLKNSYAQ